MRFDAIMYILRLLNTKNPSLTYARIDTYSDILKNLKYEKIKGKLLIGGHKKIKTLSDGSLNCKPSIHEGSKIPPPKFDITKLKIIDDEDDIKEFIVKFKGVNYTFNTYHDKELIHYRFYQSKSDNECVHVIVDKNKRKCEIHNISYDSKCMPKTEITDKKGGSLVLIALKLIDMIKDNYKLKYVMLTDNSAKYCKNKHRIELHKMLTLTTGITWYAKYGFVPKEEFYNKQFQQNKKRMDNILLKDVANMKKYLIYGHKKSKSEIDISKLIKFYESELEVDNYKLKDFLSKLLQRFDKICDIFYYFYQELYQELHLHNIGGIVYIKEI
jgi:hypothetical protein